MAIEGLTSYYQKNAKKYQVLSETDCEKLLNACFDIFENTGLDVQDPEAVKLLTDAGAKAEDGVVKVPRELVIRCINSAGKEMLLYDRAGNLKIRAGGTNTYFGLGPTNPYFNDFHTGERRASKRSDVTESAIVADACPNIDFVMGLAQISDYNLKLSDVYEGYEMLTNTTKPVIVWGVDADGLKDQVEMADAIAGGHDKLVEKPFLALFPGCPITPLIIDSKIYKKLKYSAESGLPMIWMSGIQLGTTSPVTIAGAIASNMCEMLMGVILSQLINKGCTIACGMVVLTVDMGTTYSAYGSPEHCLGEAINADLFHYLNLPTMQTGGVTDSKLVDEQAALETSMQVLVNMLSGGHLVHDVGFIDGAMSGALEQIVLTDEIVGYARRIERGITINEETLALDVIHEVGPGGEFLTNDHTLENFRDEVWFPTLLNREIYGNWERHKTDMRTRIHDKTARLLAEHRAPELPADVKARLDEILKSAEERVK